MGALVLPLTVVLNLQLSYAYTSSQRDLREKIEERISSRTERLEEMLNERKIKLSDHEAGWSLLSSEDYVLVRRQIVNFQRKLDQLSGVSPSDREDTIMREMEMMEPRSRRDYSRLQREDLRRKWMD